MFLLDTNVISEIRRPRPHGAVAAWFEAHRATRVCLSAVTIGELQTGIERLRTNDAHKAAEFERWLDKIGSVYEVLPVDGPAFRASARLMLGQSEHLLMDALIAATAQTQNLTIVTRNTHDFDLLGAPSIDPFRYGSS